MTACPLDRETVDRYIIQLNCTDLGKPAMSTILRVTVHIDDVNDNTPKFVTSSYSVQLLENHYLGAMVVQVSATDADIDVNAAISYAIADVTSARDSKDRFALDGQWKNLKGQDRDRSRQKQLDDLSSTKQGRQQRPRTGLNSPISRRRERDDGPNVAKATSWQQGYAAGNDCWANFNVNSMTGLITTRASFDYECVTTFKCRLSATDGGTQPNTGRSFITSFIIFI